MTERDRREEIGLGFFIFVLRGKPKPKGLNRKKTCSLKLVAYS
jgi:hypothetical protein